MAFSGANPALGLGMQDLIWTSQCFPEAHTLEEGVSGKTIGHVLGTWLLCLSRCLLANSSNLISTHSCYTHHPPHTHTHAVPTVLPVSLSYCLSSFTLAVLKHDHTSQLPWELL